jgi:HEPN domain-containing protein
MDSIRGWQSWFEYAENDLEAARILSIQVKPKYEIICYHCQQSAEKNLSKHPGD